MYLYIYVHAYTYVNTYEYVHVYIYEHPPMHTRTPTHPHTYINAHTDAHTHTHIHTGNLPKKKTSSIPLRAVSSFRDIPFESEEMLKFLSYERQELPLIAIDKLAYRSSDIFPEWITSHVEWRGVKRVAAGSIIDILSR